MAKSALTTIEELLAACNKHLDELDYDDYIEGSPYDDIDTSLEFSVKDEDSHWRKKIRAC
jgi:hypothetical protein